MAASDALVGSEPDDVALPDCPRLPPAAALWLVVLRAGPDTALKPEGPPMLPAMTRVAAGCCAGTLTLAVS